MFQSNQQADIAVQLVVAGLAGLKAGPAFLAALRRCADSMYIMKPWAVDHSQEQLDTLEQETDAKLNLPRQRGDTIWRHLRPQSRGLVDTLRETARELGLSHIVKNWGLANNPPAIRCATNYYGRSWANTFIRDLGDCPTVTDLFVIFVYNPEGQTSGTATLELAQTLRKTLSRQPENEEEQALQARLGSRVFIGVELGTPDPETSGETFNVVAGYMRRKELFDLLAREDQKPFDISLVIDGKPPSRYGPVPFDDLNDVAAYSIGGILTREMTDLEPRDVFSLMAQKVRWEAAFFQIGFTREEVDDLRRLHEAANNLMGRAPVLGTQARKNYSEFLQKFASWTREPFRSAPPLQQGSQLVTGLLSGRPLASSSEDLVKEALRTAVAERLAQYHLSAFNKKDTDRFERILTFQRSHAENNRAIRIDDEEAPLWDLLKPVVAIPDTSGMRTDEVRRTMEDIFRYQTPTDDTALSLITFLVFAGPAVLEDLGNFKTYESIFKQQLQSDPAGVKTQIAYPESWRGIIPGV